MREVESVEEFLDLDISREHFILCSPNMYAELLSSSTIRYRSPDDPDSDMAGLINGTPIYIRSFMPAQTIKIYVRGEKADPGLISEWFQIIYSNNVEEIEDRETGDLRIKFSATTTPPYGEQQEFNTQVVINSNFIEQSTDEVIEHYKENVKLDLRKDFEQEYYTNDN